jgi:hypothetical protein
VIADNKERLDKAVSLLLETLAPTNTEYEGVKITANGTVNLTPIIPEFWSGEDEEEYQYYDEEDEGEEEENDEQENQNGTTSTSTSTGKVPTVISTIKQNSDPNFNAKKQPLLRNIVTINAVKMATPNVWAERSALVHGQESPTPASSPMIEPHSAPPPPPPPPPPRPTLTLSESSQVQALLTSNTMMTNTPQTQHEHHQGELSPNQMVVGDNNNQQQHQIIGASGEPALVLFNAGRKNITTTVTTPTTGTPKIPMMMPRNDSMEAVTTPLAAAQPKDMMYSTAALAQLSSEQHHRLKQGHTPTGSYNNSNNSSSFGLWGSPVTAETAGLPSISSSSSPDTSSSAFGGISFYDELRQAAQGTLLAPPLSLDDGHHHLGGSCSGSMMMTTSPLASMSLSGASSGGAMFLSTPQLSEEINMGGGTTVKPLGAGRFASPNQYPHPQQQQQQCHYPQHHIHTHGVSPLDVSSSISGNNNSNGNNIVGAPTNLLGGGGGSSSSDNNNSISTTLDVKYQLHPTTSIGNAGFPYMSGTNANYVGVGKNGVGNQHQGASIGEGMMQYQQLQQDGMMAHLGNRMMG